MSENVHKGHRERMRQRFLVEGTKGFADHELLELLLYYAVLCCAAGRCESAGA